MTSYMLFCALHVYINQLIKAFTTFSRSIQNESLSFAHRTLKFTMRSVDKHTVTCASTVVLHTHAHVKLLGIANSG